METLYHLYTKSIRKIVNLPIPKRIITNTIPSCYSFSESIYIRDKDIESRLLDVFCDKNKISLDIGTLWGGYTFLIRKYSKEVIAFEPNIQNYKFLESSFSNSKNVKIINCAVSDKNGTAEFRIPSNNPGNATIEDKNSLAGFNNVDKYSVKTVIIDELNLQNIGFIKIDIEGHEFPAIAGMKNTLQKELPVLLIEIEDRHNPDSLPKVEEFMTSLNYKGFFIKDSSICSIKNFEVSKFQLDSLRNTSGYINNFIFLPGNNYEHYLNQLLHKGINHTK